MTRDSARDLPHSLGALAAWRSGAGLKFWADLIVDDLCISNPPTTHPATVGELTPNSVKVRASFHHHLILQY